MNSVPENIGEVLEQVRLAAEKAGRFDSEIEVVAVTKTVPVDKIKLAISAGMNVLGENRVQELVEKYPLLDGDLKWHLIGHLQSNKIKHITDKVSLIHSLDSLDLARELHKRMWALGRAMDVLVQVNVSEEITKHGFRIDDTLEFIDNARHLQGIRIKGLMTIAPYVSDPESVRPVFRQLRKLAEEVKTIGFPEVEMRHLSMGMSNDYKVAIEEGATLIRLGSIIFG